MEPRPTEAADPGAAAPAPVPAADVAALLAPLGDRSRLRVVSALVLGARTPAEIAAATDLGTRTVVTALSRLRAGELVIADDDGGYRFDTDRFVAAIRAAAAANVGEEEEEKDAADEVDAPLEGQLVLRNFMKDGRLTAIPTARAKRMAVLDFLAAQFEPGRVYPERDVNLTLARFHADVAALRRYLVDEEFMERRDGFYWRVGGTFAID